MAGVDAGIMGVAGAFVSCVGDGGGRTLQLFSDRRKLRNGLGRLLPREHMRSRRASCGLRWGGSLARRKTIVLPEKAFFKAMRLKRAVNEFETAICWS